VVHAPNGREHRLTVTALSPLTSEIKSQHAASPVINDGIRDPMVLAAA
jgi:hypothetical protein